MRPSGSVTRTSCEYRISGIQPSTRTLLPSPTGSSKASRVGLRFLVLRVPGSDANGDSTPRAIEAAKGKLPPPPGWKSQNGGVGQRARMSPEQRAQLKKTRYEIVLRRWLGSL